MCEILLFQERAVSSAFQKQHSPSFRPMPEKWCMDAPITDQRMESSKSLNFLDPGIRRDDEAGEGALFLVRH